MAENARVLYHCRNIAVLRTSWIEENPGRRFQCCQNREGGCSFFRWVDDPLCPRARAIIPGLLWQLNVLENERDTFLRENVELEKRMKWLQALLLGVLLGLLIWWLV
ncbi:DNA-(apurinic or apyrimidinic site) lyase [Handroanthus impetiginosus]|uniref:DNA-(Apurinic or apyrimidinic site) lyase n=1 Tax=Handroanthus impetiginosus TaxID=429701 RepID=A0A2G9GM15_9LAMI|nr:DNA-(apurinic or apyrimidinic site) lyase [Handroanthus impetiginosus]